MGFAFSVHSDPCATSTWYRMMQLLFNYLKHMTTSTSRAVLKADDLAWHEILSQELMTEICENSDTRQQPQLVIFWHSVILRFILHKQFHWLNFETAEQSSIEWNDFAMQWSELYSHLEDMWWFAQPIHHGYRSHRYIFVCAYWTVKIQCIWYSSTI